MSWRACVVCVGVCVCRVCVCMCVWYVCVCAHSGMVEGCKGSAYQPTCLMGVHYSLCWCVWRCEGGRGERKGRDGGRKWQTNLSSMWTMPCSNNCITNPFMLTNLTRVWTLHNVIGLVDGLNLQDTCMVMNSNILHSNSLLHVAIMQSLIKCDLELESDM